MSTRLRHPATQHDIARHLGIGQKTVSRVFTQPGLVSASLAEKVIATAKKLGYRPNSGARAMRSGRFRTVALVQSTTRMASPMPEELIIGIDESLSQADVSLVLARLPDDELVGDGFVPKVTRELLADGMLLNYDTNIPARLGELIVDHRLPVVWINSRHEGISVRPDDEGSASALTQCLLGLGHRRILYADFFLGHTDWVHYSRTDRLGGYRAAMAGAGLSPMEAVGGRDEAPMLYAQSMLKRQGPTAVIGYGDIEASAFIMAALSQGMAIPRDISFATFGPRPFFCGIPIATSLVPQLEMGRSAARQLLNIVAEDGDIKSVVIPFTLDVGESIAPPPLPARSAR